MVSAWREVMKVRAISTRDWRLSKPGSKPRRPSEPERAANEFFYHVKERKMSWLAFE